MARVKLKQKKEKPEIVINSLALTPDTQETLQRLSGITQGRKAVS
jgi:hypothetical protein